MNSDKNVAVLFVCLGNICRSPSAEAVFTSHVQAAGLSEAIDIDSAGILSMHEGDPADARMRKHALARGYELLSRSRPVRQSDFEQFDYIIAMDNANVYDLEKRAPNKASMEKVSLMLNYAPELGRSEVPDPYYGGSAGFEDVLDLLGVACAGLLQKIIDEQ